MAAAVALAAVVALAVLQYRWIGQLSQAEEERVRAHVAAAASGFARDFEADLDRAFAVVLSPRRGPARTFEDEIAARYEQWGETDSKTGLLRAIYIVSPRGTELRRLETATLRFVPAAWPAELEPVRSRLARSTPLDPPNPGMPLLLDDPPLLALPILDDTSGRPALRGWTVAQLDRDYLTAHLLPALGRKYFPASDNFDFQLQIAAKDDRSHVVWSSDAALAPSFFAGPDVAQDVFYVRPPAIRERRPRPGPPPRDGPHGPEIHPPFDAGPPSDRPPPREPGLRAGLPYLGRPDADDRPPLRPGDPLRPRWELRVKERSGSLAGVVAQARRRNLAISFAVLLLMAGASAALLLSTRRRHRLARMQLEFVAGVSHELRTPLAVICSAADNMAAGVIGNPQQVRRYGEVVRDEGRRLAHMVEQVLSFAGLQAGRARFDPRPVAADEIIARAVALCEPEAKAAGTAIEVRIEPGTPPLRADAAALVQAVRNLLDNARKHAGGNVGITARAVPGGMVEITVTDSGPGIPAAERRRIFEPFYRGRRAVSAQVPGSGIGLALVRRIAEAHGGTATLTCGPQGGACFVLRIPAAQEAEVGATRSAD